MNEPEPDAPPWADGDLRVNPVAWHLRSRALLAAALTTALLAVSAVAPLPLRVTAMVCGLFLAVCHYAVWHLTR